MFPLLVDRRCDNILLEAPSPGLEPNCENDCNDFDGGGDGDDNDDTDSDNDDHDIRNDNNGFRQDQHRHHHLE